MKIVIAGEQKEVKDGITVAQLIQDEKVENPQYVTVTLNDEFLKSDALADTVIKENDSIEFLYFMGGGSL